MEELFYKTLGNSFYYLLISLNIYFSYGFRRNPKKDNVNEYPTLKLYMLVPFEIAVFSVLLSGFSFGVIAAVTDYSKPEELFGLALANFFSGLLGLYKKNN